MRRPNENARMAERSQITMCLQMAESEHVVGNSDPHRSSSANTNFRSSGTKMSGNTTTAESGRKNRMVTVSFTLSSFKESNSRNRHVAATSASTATYTHECTVCVDSRHPKANPAAMPDVAVARYERQTTRCRPSDTFRSTGGRSCRRKKHSCRAYATSATKGNSSAKKKLISLPANRSPAQAMVAQAKMPCM